MKFLSILAAAAITCSVALTSCSKSNSDLINELKQKTTEATEAAQNGDILKATKIAAEASEIANELSKRDLTDEEKMELLSIEK